MRLREDAVRFADGRPAALHRGGSTETGLIEVEQLTRFIARGLLQFREGGGLQGELLWVAFFLSEYRPRL